MIVSVILDIKNNQCNKTFDYLVPECYLNVIKVGARVFVPFGSRRLLGIVVKINNESEFVGKLKPIIELLDFDPIIDEELLDLGNEISSKYFSFLIESYLMMLPQALKAKYHKYVEIIDIDAIPEHILAIFKNRDKAPIEDFNNCLKDILNLKSKGYLNISNDFKQKGNVKTKNVITLIDKSKAKRSNHLSIASYLEEIGGIIDESVLVNDMGYSKAVLKTMINNGVIALTKEEIYRDVYVRKVNNNVVTLNSEQQYAVDEISKSFNEYNQFLLHGVCGSGKTEVYLNLIEKVIADGKQAIMLVPEISLTPQMAQRFKARFKENVAIMHSRLSMGEKYDEWRRIRRREANIVVGARSALFVPMDNIGIIIMDEEQESSYIQDTNPKYDAHFVAQKRAIYHKCPFVMGSATPKVSTYYEALNGNIKLLELKERANKKEIATSKVVDMRSELLSGNKSVFSRELKQELISTIRRNEQAVLLINRRGYSTFVMCRSCGQEIKCPNCDVSLTYHKYNERLSCHYCGYNIHTPSICPSCESPYIRFVGDGTQKVEEELKNILPEARVIRMDSDTTGNKNGHDDIISKFQNHEADILLGTQVVAKGLDFPLVSLVGIVNADLGLKMPFYDAYEKTYNLIEQASGRAGRKDTDGKVIIQTYNPEHLVIESASKHNYKEFYLEELNNREISLNPPFSELINVVISSEDAQKAFKEALFIKQLIENKSTNSKVLGPVENYIFKMNNRFHFQITIKLKEHNSLEVLSYLNERYQAMKDVFIQITRM